MIPALALAVLSLCMLRRIKRLLLIPRTFDGKGTAMKDMLCSSMHRPNAQMPTTKLCLEKKKHFGFSPDGSVCDFDSGNWKLSMEQETIGFSAHRSSLPAAQSQRDMNCRYTKKKGHNWNSMLIRMGGPAKQTENLNSLVELKGLKRGKHLPIR